jgi:protein TonB
MESVPAPEAAESGMPSEENANPTAAPAGEGDPSAGLPLELPRTDATHLNNPAPHYPTLSRRFGEQGRVLLDVYILPDGSVGEIRLNTSSGFRRLDEAALAAVRNWRFVPARRGESAIPYWYVQPITFSLNR